MIIEDGKFYFIKDEFFNMFKDYGLMINKENGNKRPCYFCFKDRQNSEIIWFVPISSKSWCTNSILWYNRNEKDIA